MTCYGNNSLLLIRNSNTNAYNDFYKYNLSFQLLATSSSNSYSFPNELQNIVGIATDGRYLYIQGSKTGSNSDRFTLGKATLGNLK